MNASERERRHRGNLDRIQQVQLVVGRGDRARVDHEGTLLERARMLSEELRSHQATERGLEALDRLLRVAEEPGSRQGARVAAFIAAVWEDRPVRLSMLRGLDLPCGDDAVAVLDALRYGRVTLAEHVTGGPRRVAKALAPRRAALA